MGGTAGGGVSRAEADSPRTDHVARAGTQVWTQLGYTQVATVKPLRTMTEWGRHCRTRIHFPEVESHRGASCSQ